MMRTTPEVRFTPPITEQWNMPGQWKMLDATDEVVHGLMVLGMAPFSPLRERP
jgi:hypothetical protein